MFGDPNLFYFVLFVHSMQTKSRQKFIHSWIRRYWGIVLKRNSVIFLMTGVLLVLMVTIGLRLVSSMKYFWLWHLAVFCLFVMLVFMKRRILLEYMVDK